MAEEKIDIKESFTYLFKEGRLSKILPIACFEIFITFLVVLNILVFKFLGTGVGIILFLIGFFLVIFIELYITGYFIVYSRNRAFNKNALFRDISFNVCNDDVFITGLKFCLIYLIFGIIVSIFNMSIPNYDKLYRYTVLTLFLFGFPLTKIMTYFLKDLTLKSLFSWKKAFQYTKGVKGLLLVVAVPILVYCFSIALYYFKFPDFLIHLLPSKIYMILATTIAIFINILQSLIVLYSVIVYCNLLGQYAYNAYIKNGVITNDNNIE